MPFKIFTIVHGWFEVVLNKDFMLTNSDFMGCDAPFLLLEGLCDLMENKETEIWLCWQDEPGACILMLERQGDNLVIQIYDADKKSHDLDYSGIALSKHITKCLYKMEANMIKTAKNIFEEFELYENGNGRKRYDVHWGEFPQQPYARLKNLLRTK